MPKEKFTLWPRRQSGPIEEVVLVTSGDLRQSANVACWPAQREMERQLTESFAREGVRVRRAFEVDAPPGHGFISSQRMGMDVFMRIHPAATVVVCRSRLAIHHNLLAGPERHRGPILTVANWTGQWPGRVGMLNLNGSLRKAGVHFSSLWSKDFNDEFLRNGIRQWMKENGRPMTLPRARLWILTMPEPRGNWLSSRQPAEAPQSPHGRLR